MPIFRPLRALGTDPRTAHIENYLVEISKSLEGLLVQDQTGEDDGGGDPTLFPPEDEEDTAPTDHDDLENVTPDQHHARKHRITSVADHEESGLNPDDVLTALTPTTFGWMPLPPLPPSPDPPIDRAPFGPFTRQSINNAMGGGTYSPMKVATGPSAGISSSVEMPWAGRVWGISVSTDNPVAGGDYTVRLALNGVTDAAVSATLFDGTRRARDVHVAGVPFAAGDEVAIYDTKSAPLAVEEAVAFLFLTFDEEGGGGGTPIDHDDLANVTPNQHHAKLHDIQDPAHHSSSVPLVNGEVLTATGPGSFAFQPLPPPPPGAAPHNIEGAQHFGVGLNPGEVLMATGPSSFAFQPLPTSDDAVASFVMVDDAVPPEHWRVTITRFGVLVTTPLYVNPPKAPQNLVTIAASPTSIHVFWDFRPGADTYTVEHSVDGALWFSLAAGIVPPGYLHTGLTPGTIHHYRAWATNEHGDSPHATNSNPPLYLTTSFAYTTPAQVTGLSVAAGGPGVFNLTWTALAAAPGSYWVEASLNATSWVDVGSSTTNSFSHTGLTVAPGTTVYYRVRARSPLGTPINTGDNYSHGAYSSVASGIAS